MAPAQFDLVVVANRLPVDLSLDEDGETSWTRSPGGLVTALAPVMAKAEGAWVGWGGQPAFFPRNVGNPDLGPERTTEIEAGFDGAFFGVAA